MTTDLRNCCLASAHAWGLTYPDDDHMLREWLAAGIDGSEALDAMAQASPHSSDPEWAIGIYTVLVLRLWAERASPMVLPPDGLIG